MVVSDFAYADVAYDGYVPPSFLAAPGAKEVGVEFTTMCRPDGCVLGCPSRRGLQGD